MDVNKKPQEVNENQKIKITNETLLHSSLLESEDLTVPQRVMHMYACMRETVVVSGEAYFPVTFTSCGLLNAARPREFD